MRYEDFENKPLPDHTKVNYYECLAKLTLEQIFPEEFNNLLIKDKPDLQNEEINVGVEVTKANNPQQEEDEKLFRKIEHGEIRDKEKAIKKINDAYKIAPVFIDGEIIRQPDRYSPGMLIGIPEKDSFDRILDAFKKKVKKLNENNYKVFSKNFLFVFSEILANEEMIEKAICDMKDMQIQYKLKFNKVFVYVPKYFYILDLVNKRGIIKIIDKYQLGLGERARDMVIECEIME